MSGTTAAPEDFVSEPITPLAATGDASAMSRGEPGLPRWFRWRQQEFEVLSIVSKWKTSSRDRGELYLRRHWFELVTTNGMRMVVYCQRQPASAKRLKSRWWLYKLSRAV